LPALLARRALARAAAGRSIEILCDDPLAAVDVPHMCSREGYEVISIEKQSVETRLVLRRPAPADGSCLSG
jgi:tRNA 2-thiouridine synthesizing protein A